jgi:hypothetical protein
VRFVESRGWIRRSYRICAAYEGRECCFEFPARCFAAMQETTRDGGVARVGGADGENLWWAGRDELYWIDAAVEGADVELLLWDQRRRRDGRMERLRRIRAREVQLEAARRERIPEDVRNFVWLRDEGRCVRCGAEEDLQLDHVIPYARGGGNGAENIQILCGSCNREKADSIG